MPYITPAAPRAVRPQAKKEGLALHPVLKGKPLAPRKVFIWTGILVTIGIVLTFPIFFPLFAPAE